MIHAARAIAATAALATSLSCGEAADAACRAPHGDRIVLASEAVDPDVFVWDSRDRLLTYAAGQWRDTRAIFAHTLLAEPGTQAVVISCSAVASRSAAPPGQPGTIGVRVMSGRYRGRYGWVLQSDTHLASRPTGHAAVSKRF
ncbi:MAG: hypothetical protein GIX03_13015 [Candidatus Eremiobacteraeota bacterium]|nr:hypothetical protein [Candidatus Eremiobacteraeota bacterium]MBC5803886.1 hypothetical protein [Candidatus Eremiobacteraeota bacterium]MBC5821390.1 hypothetical protein [Candidatus Eremiobacteraeota bacterium]